MTQTIAPATTIGVVELNISSLDHTIPYYTDTLGFELLQRKDNQAILGAGKRPLVVLNEKQGARKVPGTTGLYHFAVLLPDRRSLARLLYHLAEIEMEVQGAADHGVSDSLYLADPDGNGIELYRDRKRDEWPVDDLKKLQMGTDELDVDDLVMELKNGVPPWNGLPDKTIIGHVHLHVRDLNEAEQFYTQVLGFQAMQRYGSGALFVSAGGYHHHIGLNTWVGVGAPPPPPDAVGLRFFEVLLPDQAALDALVNRLDAAGVPYERQEAGMLVHDPSQNALLF